MDIECSRKLTPERPIEAANELEMPMTQKGLRAFGKELLPKTKVRSPAHLMLALANSYSTLCVCVTASVASCAHAI